MKGDDFAMFQGLLKQRSGLVLSRDKAYLLESRLMPVARKWNLRGLDELAQTVRTKKDERLLRDITEAMTTNESSFFRDSKPFDQFRQIVLPHFVEARRSTGRVRVWSAAASSGQEPYSLAMVLKEEAAKLQGLRVEIVATDISADILASSYVSPLRSNSSRTSSLAPNESVSTASAPTRRNSSWMSPITSGRVLTRMSVQFSQPQ